MYMILFAYINEHYFVETMKRDYEKKSVIKNLL